MINNLGPSQKVNGLFRSHVIYWFEVIKFKIMNETMEGGCPFK